jgi:hypothetical protein
MRFLLATGSRRELQTAQQLRRLLGAYAVSEWIFTRDIRIESRAVSHSHPVLTLNTLRLDDDDRLLATFVHEQLHWGVQGLDKRLVTQLAVRYPDLPIGSPEGCRSMFSNYLHVVICALEYQALIKLIGRTRARGALHRANHYRRIYEVVMSDHDQLIALIRDYVEIPLSDVGDADVAKRR